RDARWRPVPTPDPTYQVEMPGNPVQFRKVFLPGWNLVAFELTTDPVHYVAGSAIAANPGLDDAAWFEEVRKAVLRESRGQPDGEPVERGDKVHPGRQWEVELPDNPRRRVVRVYRIDGRMYYLAADGPNLSADDDDVKRFF